MYESYLFIFLFSIYFFIILGKRLEIAKYLGLLDLPNKRKKHQEPTPAIGFFLFTPIILFGLFQNYSSGFITLKIFIIWLIVLTIFSLIGIIDDIKPIDAKIKFFLVIFSLLILIPLDKSLIINSLIFDDVNKIILLNEGSVFFTVFCIFFLYNSLNFSDGLNGIVICNIIFYVSYIYFFKNDNPFYLLIIFSLILTLFPNLLGKVFCGNTGVNFLSILISLILINEYNNNNLKFDEIILILFLPCIDTVRLTAYRIINNKSPLSPDLNHFHHYLTKIFNYKIVFIPYTLFALAPILIQSIFGLSYLIYTMFVVIYFLIILYLFNVDHS